MNNFVQAKFIGIRRLLQAREDLVISFATDYSGIQVEAGDVIKVTLSQYGWTNKLFRVSNVTEEKYPDGNLGARLVAFEYNDSIYDDDLDITDFVPADNTGLTDPNIISTPDAPQILVNDLGTIDTFQVFGNVPDTGLVTNLDFNFGTDSNVSNHTFYSTVNNANGIPLTNSDSANSVYNTYVVDVSTLPTGNYYWSLTARNRFVGVDSNASNVVNWNGTNVSTPNTTSFCNATSNGTTITSDALPFDSANTLKNDLSKAILSGLNLQVVSGTGEFAANTKITSFTSNTQYTINNVPTVPLSNACIKFVGGGITGNNVQDGSIDIDKLAPGTEISTFVVGYSYNVADIAANTVVLPVNMNTIGANIKLESINGNFETPKYLTSVYSGGGGFYPYFTGNSSTADGYIANSTARFQPLDAVYLGFNNGDLNWQIADYQYFGNLFSAGESIGIDWTVNFIANANCTIQVLPIITYSLIANTAVGETSGGFDVINLIANQPFSYRANGVFTGDGIVDGSGVGIRNFTSSANIIIESGSFAIYRAL
jgi:hypothetical protein